MRPSTHSTDGRGQKLNSATASSLSLRLSGSGIRQASLFAFIIGEPRTLARLAFVIVAYRSRLAARLAFVEFGPAGVRF